ncbi:MAG: SDR family oxidoreductase [Rhodospirillales bacterium]
MQLAQKTVIVTGASSGIGEAAALLFAAEGAKLVLGARRQRELELLVGRIEAAGGTARCLAGDVQDDAYAAALVALAVSAYGGLDVAFNNAGAMGATAPLAEMPVENWQRVLATNLTSGFFAARQQIPALRARGGGSMIFTSTFVGHTAGLPGMGAYAAAKAGLVGLVQVLAAELGAEAIRVNALLPGGTKTAMAGDDLAVLEFVEGLHALKRMAAPEEIARAALFLASDASSFVTGSALLVDGGVSIAKT